MELTKRSWRISQEIWEVERLSIELSPSHLGFMLSRIRFDWLRFDCVAVGSFFGFDTVMVRIAE
jgi:hypothetical protein